MREDRDKEELDEILSMESVYWDIVDTARARIEVKPVFSLNVSALCKRLRCVSFSHSMPSR